MKLSYFQLEAHISKKKLAPIYLISGEELLLKQDTLQLLRKAAKQANFNERTRLSDVDCTEANLYPLLYTNSLLNEARSIELNFRDNMPNKVIGKMLSAYCEQYSNSNLLIIEVGKLDAKTQKSAWYQAIEKIGVVIQIWPIPREQLPQWIAERCKKYKLTIDKEATNLLADYVEGNLIAAAQAIEKVYLLKPTTTIDATIIKTVLINESQFSIFDFVDTLLAGEQRKALSILEQLKLDGIEPILILWGITRELRLLQTLITAHAAGEPKGSLWQKHRIFPRRQPLIQRLMTHYSSQQCDALLTAAAEIDYLIKGAKIGNVWEAMALFCLRFATY